MNGLNNSADMSIVWKKYKRGPNNRLRNRLIKHYLPLVRLLSEKLRAQLPGCVDQEDLASAGVFGLVDAIKLFDLSREIKFETYCVNRIRGAMLDELRDLDWVPRLVRSKNHQLKNACKKLESKLGRPPTEFEMKKELRLSDDEYLKLVKDAAAISILRLNHKNSSEENEPATETSNLLKDNKEKDSFLMIQNKELIEYIKNKLSEKERLVLELYFYDDLTMKQIGRVLDISESRVSQIFARLMERLQSQYNRHKYDWL
ncbi:MAG: FliA/WhiG family RNA polymerase sigma factor [Planctomycetota bacterium]